MPASSGTAAARVEKRIVAEMTYNREIAVRPQALAVAGWQVLNSSYSTSVATAESMSRLGADDLEAQFCINEYCGWPRIHVDGYLGLCQRRSREGLAAFRAL